jgi:hypothetical protein
MAFKNIPYAQPPVDENTRFAPPQYIYEAREGVNNGSNINICPQMDVGWVRAAMEFMTDFKKVPLPSKWRTKLFQKVSLIQHAENASMVLSQFVKTNYSVTRIMEIIPRWMNVVMVMSTYFYTSLIAVEFSPRGLFDAKCYCTEVNLG